MKVLVTGAFGIVGRATMDALLEQGHEVRAFDVRTRKTARYAGKYRRRAEIRFGDIRNVADVGEAVKGMDAVIHLAAIIPPLADRIPQFASYVNLGGTENVVRAISRQVVPPRLVFTSSIATYGDRLKNPNIKVSDDLNPNDEYARQKVACESFIKTHLADWVVFRLTYIVSMDKLDLDPLLFHMPLDTCIEICDASDTGKALAASVNAPGIAGKTMNLAGGARCRTTFRDYLDTMLGLFGLGSGFLPETAFATQDFHCGYMDTEETEKLLHYQTKTLGDYYAEVRRKVKVTRFFARMVKPMVRTALLKLSPFYKREKPKRKYAASKLRTNGI